MLRVYESNHDKLIEYNILSDKSIKSGTWFCLIKPTEDELKVVTEVTQVPLEFLKAPLDEEERPRLEVEDNCLLIIFNIPIMKDENTFDTIPLGIIITPAYFITVCLMDNKILSYFNSDNYKQFCTYKRTRFLFQMLYKSAELYLRYLRYINIHTDEIEMNLRKSMKNQTLFQLLELEKSLVYFTTSLKDNGIVTQKILRLRSNSNFQELLEIFEEDEDLLEDVIIENKQALEMVEMHSNILGSMMNAFASIISNNLNMVMKFLTSMTILLAIPTMIASFFGMNVHVPWGQHALGFIFVVVLSSVITTLTAFMLLKRQMF